MFKLSSGNLSYYQVISGVLSPPSLSRPSKFLIQSMMHGAGKVRSGAPRPAGNSKPSSGTSYTLRIAIPSQPFSKPYPLPSPTKYGKGARGLLGVTYTI